MRRRHESTALIGALWLLGGTLVLLTVWPVPGFDDMPAPGVVAAVAGFATAFGCAIMLAAKFRDGLSRPLQETAVAIASVAIAVVVVAGGAQVAGAYGGLYGFVAAASFLSFPVPRAMAQLVFAGASYAVALALAGWPGGPAIWMVVIGVATGGASLFGFFSSRAEALADAEREVARDLERLEQTRRTFLQAVSHELRTPLTAVLGFATVLKLRAETLEPEMARLLHERIHAQATRLDLLLTDLLDIERLSRGGVLAKREPTMADYLIEQATRQVETGTLRVVQDVEAVVISVEPAKAERMVVNLVANASKHATGATTIWLTGRLVGDAFVLTVADDGIGIDPRERNDILLPFTQGRHAEDLPSPGTGLGLSIVSRFAQIHGGAVEVGDRPGGGAQFVVTLARANPEKPPAGEQGSSKQLSASPTT